MYNKIYNNINRLPHRGSNAPSTKWYERMVRSALCETSFSLEKKSEVVLKTTMKYAPKTRIAARRETNRLIAEYQIDDAAGEALLRTFASAFSLEISCQEQIDREGLTIIDRFDQIKPHPLLSALRDARSQKLAALKALNLDIEPVGEQGRSTKNFRGIV